MLEELRPALGEFPHRTLQAIIGLHDGTSNGGIPLAWVPGLVIDCAVFGRLGQAPVDMLVRNGLIEFNDCNELPVGEFICGGGRSVTFARNAQGQLWYFPHGGILDAAAIHWPVRAFRPTAKGRREAALPPSYEWLNLNVIEKRKRAPSAGRPYSPEFTLEEETRTGDGANTLKGRLTNAATKAGIATLKDEHQAVARAARNWLIDRGYTDQAAGTLPVMDVIAMLDPASAARDVIASVDSWLTRDAGIPPIRVLGLDGDAFPGESKLRADDAQRREAARAEFLRDGPALAKLVETRGGDSTDVLAMLNHAEADNETAALALWPKLKPSLQGCALQVSVTPLVDKGVDSKTESTAANSGDGERTHNRWVTVRQAATISGAAAGVISRAADNGDLTTNGRHGRERRIDTGSLAQWALERARGANKDTGETDEQVERLVRKHVRD